MTSCPSDAQLVMLLEERLGVDELSEVVLHLESCEDCQGMLEHLTDDHLTNGRSAAPSRLAGLEGLLAPGSRLAFDDPEASRLHAADSSGLGRGARRRDGGGRLPSVAGYEIEARLGSGGMGVVYRARHRRLNRPVALKMIRAGGQARPEHLARFRIEAEAVASLHHPNIVQIYDVGEVDGLPYFALELLEGGSLEARVAGTPQPERPAAALLATLAGAIHAAHGAGIIHRDLKSSNILFTADGIPKVTDFGLAKRLDEDDNQTTTGQVLGSPSFMAPEQARGLARAVGPAADVYALGAILYEMLTGRPPFKGTTPMETVIDVIHKEPIPPSRLRPRLSRDLETICLKCLAKEPHRRYAGAGALGDDLARYLAGGAIRGRRTSAAERGLKWARRQPAAAALAALGGMAVVGLAVAGYRYDDHLRAEGRRVASLRAEAAATIARGRDAHAQGRPRDGRDPLIRLLATLKAEPALGDLGTQADGLLRRIDRGLADERARLADEGRREAFLRLRDEALFHDTQFTGLELPGNVEATRAAARQALALFPGPTPASLTDRGREEVAEGCYELLLVLAEAEAQPMPGEDPATQAGRALALLDRASSLRPPSKAYHLRRAACLEKAGDAGGAGSERRAADRLRPGDAFDHLLSGQACYKRREWSAARLHFEQALRLRPDQFWARALLAVCDLHARRPAEARAGLTACIERRPNFTWLYLVRGYAYGEDAHLNQRKARQSGAPAAQLEAEAASEFDAAEADYQAALKLKPGEDDLYVLRVNRGTMRIQRRRLDEAEADLRSAIRLRPRQFVAYVALAQALRQAGRADEAAGALTTAIAMRPDLPSLYRDRAQLETARESPGPAERAAALRDLDEAIRLAPPGSPEAAADQARRAELLALGGRFEAALAACDAALAVVPDDPAAHRVRVRALLELKRHDEVIAACDGYLARGKPSAEIFAIRGLARAGREDYAGAIQDYTQALALQPARAAFRAHRGWAYLVSDAPKLAIGDFDEAIRLDSGDPDAYNGRGFARAMLGQHGAAVADADEAIRRGGTSSRTLYNAARICARAADVAAAEAPRNGLALLQVADDYRDRAQGLLRRSLESLPGDRRPAFLRDVIRADPAFAALRRRPKFGQLAASLARPDP